MKGRHVCPGCRKVDVSDTILACAPCWWKLTQTTRNLIFDTAKMSILSPGRRVALERAMKEWKALRPPR